MEAPNWLPFIAICGLLFTISTLCLLLIRRIFLGIVLSLSPILMITIYVVIDIYKKYEEIPSGEGIVFLIYFFSYLYIATFLGVIWGAIVRYLIVNARILRSDRQTPAIRFAAASALVIAPTAIMLFTTWDRQRDADEACFAHGIPLEIGNQVVAPHPIRGTSVNLPGRGQTSNDQLSFHRREVRRELCDLSGHGTRPVPTSILTFHWSPEGDNALFRTFNPECDPADLREASTAQVNSCTEKRSTFMPYFKGMSLRVPADEYWLLSEAGKTYVREVHDAMTPSGAQYCYQCTGPIETSFYEGGRFCTGYRFINEEVVVQISFKTRRDEDVDAVLERFEQDLPMILSKLEWMPG